MINKYNFVNFTSSLRIFSLLLVLMLAPLSGNNYIQAAIHSQMSVNETDPSKAPSAIINPGLDPKIALSSNSITLSAAANSTGQVNVSSNITWIATIDPADAWLKVSPGTGNGNGTLTFTADANLSKSNSRTAYVLIHASGVADQTIIVTQSEEKPAVTFSSSVTTGSLSITLQFLLGGTFYIDWGNGVQVAQTANINGQPYFTTIYEAGKTVKVYASGITNVRVSSGSLTSIVVAESPNLQKLVLDHNNLTSLDLSRNTNLTTLDCSYNDLGSLDISQNTQMYDLSLGYNNLSVLDLSRNSNLSILSCIANKLTTLDVTHNPALTTLHCYQNKLTSLDVSRNSLLKILYCYSNNLTYFNNSIPPVKSYTSYSYAPQANIPASVVSNTVDINSQLYADMNGIPQRTVYTWYNKTNGVRLISGTDYSESDGVFTFLKNPSDSVYCTMSNAAFPLFTDGDILRTVNLKVQLVIPVVATIDVPVLKIGSTTATVNCNITNLGIPNPTSHGVCWTTNSLVAPTISDTKSDLGIASAVGPFSVDISALAPGTTYYVRAYATNQAGTGYGVVIPFTTTGRIPAITTEPVTVIGIHSAIGHGTITDLGAPLPSDYGVVWSTTPSPTVELSNKSAQGPTSTLGAFTSNIVGLIPNTTYFVRAYATNSVGTKYGNEVSFKTSSIQLTIADPTFNPLSKVYDGNSNANFIPGALTGVELSDDVSLNLVTSKATYDNANVGSGKTITVTYTLTGTSAFKYLAPPVYTTSTGAITPAPLTVIAVLDTKTYDGNTNSVGIPTVVSLLPGDVALTPAIQVFDNANFGSGHVLTASGLTIKNSSNTEVTGNYTINYVPSPASGVINKLVVTVTAVSDTKTYDGNTGSMGIPTVVTLATGDVALTPATQVFDNADYGLTHVLTASGLTIKNGSGVNVTGNYTINYVQSPASGVINKLVVTVTAVTDTKTYDGSTSSVVTPTIVSLLAGDAPLTPATQVYDNANYGNDHVLTASGLTIKNGSGVNVTGNYTINYVPSPANGVINRLAVTVTAVPDTKTYDGTTSSVGTPTVVSLLAGDAPLTPAIQAFDNADYGLAHVLTASGLTIKNGSGVNVTNNYTINYVPSPASGVINKLVVTVTAVSDTKTYDGNTSSLGIPTVVTLATGDVALTPAIQVFDNSSFGSSHVLTASGLTIKNSSNTEVTGNYTINYVPSAASGVINKRDVTVTAVTDTKIYDATVSSVGKPIVGLLATGDTINDAPIQKFDNVFVGNSHIMIASGLSIKKISTGEDVSPNYNIIYVNSLNDGVILGKPTTATIPLITESKVYDGTTSAVVIPGILSGVDAIDIPNVKLNATASYDNATIGNGKTITVKYTLSGSVGDTYAAPSDYVIHTGEITGKALTASNPNFTSEKVYDGTTVLNVTPGVLFGVEAADADKVTLNATAAFDNAKVGTGKTITVTYTLSGSAAINYTVPASFTVTDGVITGKPLTVVSLKLTTGKVYDGSNSAIFSVGSLSGVETLDSENVILSGTATYDNANAGTNKVISVAFNITGSAANNYIVPSDYTITNGEITAKPLTITNPVVVTDKMYDGNTTAVITTLGSLVGVEQIDVNNVAVTAVANYNSMTVGDNKTISVVYTLSGTAKDNYSAPVDFSITGSKISDNVTLSSTINSTSGCEGSYLDLEYTILTGTPTQYKITFSASALAAGIHNIDYTDLTSMASTGVLPVTIPKGTKDGIYQGTLQMRNELGVETILYAFRFTINVSSDFIIPKFDDVVLCDNSSNNFIAYQWYKNGIIIDGATKQFYNDLDGLIGSYSLKVTTTDGQILYTCAKDLNIPLIQKISVYPSPLKVNQPCTVKMTGMTNAELEGAELSIYTMQGSLIYHSVKVERLNSVYLPSVDGMYLGNVTTSKGQVFPFKIIVEK